MKARRHLHRNLALLLVAAGAAGCASGGRPTMDRQAGQGEQISITVENQNFKDATVYAVWRSSGRDRLGLVTGNTTQTFTVPWKGGDLAVRVDFIAGSDVTTESMGVSRGDNLQVTIPPSR